jgi:hypothetical protein
MVLFFWNLRNKYETFYLTRGLQPEGKQPLEVDNSGCPPTKMAIIVLLTEQRAKSDTFMTTV